MSRLSSVKLHHAILWLCIGAVLSASCDSPTAPSAIPVVSSAGSAGTTPAASSPGGIAVAGKVFDTAYREIAGAVVEVVDGPSAGMIATTDGSGQFGLRGSFDENTHFRAAKAGYAEAVLPMSRRCATCNPNFWVYFYLALPVPPADITGDYTLTVIASDACTALPEQARKRTYSATVGSLATQPTPAKTLFNAHMAGANLVSGLGFNDLSFAVAADYMTLYMGDLHGQPGLLEIVDPDTYFSIGGLGSATLGASGASTIAAPFDGEIAYCELKPGLEPIVNGRYTCAPDRAVKNIVCPSSRHQLILTRR